MKIRRLAVLSMLAGSGLALSGCVAGMAASAIDMAARSARGKPQNNSQLRPQAAQACSARAAQHGTVDIIDVEQRTPSRIVVWGTATQGADRRSFECHFTTQIATFKLRAIDPRR